MTHVLPIQERLIGQREPNETFLHMVGLRTEMANIHQPFMVIQRELAEQRPHQLPREDLHEYLRASQWCENSVHTINGG